MTFKVIYIWHSEESIRVGKGSTRECHGQFTQEKYLSIGGFNLACAPLSDLPAPGLSLSAAGSNNSVAFACSRSKNGFYGETFHPFAQASPAAGARARFCDRPMGRPGLAAAPQGSWLNGLASQNSVVTLTMCLIVWRPKKSLKFIIGWCRSRRQARRKSPRN